MDAYEWEPAYDAVPECQLHLVIADRFAHAWHPTLSPGQSPARVFVLLSILSVAIYLRLKPYLVVKISSDIMTKLIIERGCRVQVFSLILDSSVSLSAGIQSAGDLVSETLGSNPAFSRGRQLVSFRFEYRMPVYIYIYITPLDYWYGFSITIDNTKKSCGYIITLNCLEFILWKC